MPRACPVEHHARRYTDGLKQPTGCHGLVPWSITRVATPTVSSNRLDATGLSRGASRSSLHRRSQATDWMPRACPGRITPVATPPVSSNRLDATGLSREHHARRYTYEIEQPTGCHGLGPWRFTLVATPTISNNRLDATGLSRGASRSSLHRRSQATDWMPPPWAVEVHARR